MLSFFGASQIDTSPISPTIEATSPVSPISLEKKKRKRQAKADIPPLPVDAVTLASARVSVAKLLQAYEQEQEKELHLSIELANVKDKIKVSEVALNRYESKLATLQREYSQLDDIYRNKQAEYQVLAKKSKNPLTRINEEDTNISDILAELDAITSDCRIQNILIQNLKNMIK